MRNPVQIALIFLTSLFFNVFFASAQCTVVVAPGGNDGNPGTVAAPFATPNVALKSATPGAVVCLRAGTYVLKADMVADKPMTIQSYPGEWAVLTADYANASPVGNIIVVGANDVTIQDLELSGASYYGVHVSSYILGFVPANTRIQRLKIHHSGFIGVKVDQADNVQILNSEIYLTGTRISGFGLDVLSSLPSTSNPNGPGATLRGNYIHDMPGVAIVLKGGTVRGIIENNRVERIGGGGIIVGGDTGAQFFRNGVVTSECVDCTARNNVVAGTDYLGISCWAAQGAQIVNNTVVDAAKLIQAAFFAVPDSLGNTCNNTTVRNNVFVTSATGRMMHVVSPGPGMVIDNNHYYNPQGNYAMWWESPSATGYWGSLGAWQSGTGQDRNSAASQDPLLDAANSYQPRPGSPLIDSGVALANVAADYAGVARPQGRAFDKGAFEVLAVSTPLPALLSAVSGTGQAATTGTAFPAPLAARVTDATGKGVAGAVVTFSAPTSGAGAAFAGASVLNVMTDASGLATTSSLSANAVSGSYAITAATGALTPVFFPLLNTAVTAPPPGPAPTRVTLTGGTVSPGASYFPVVAQVLSNFGEVSGGLVQFFVSGSAVPSAQVQVKAGRATWNFRIPGRTPSGTQFSLSAVFTGTPQYAGSHSAPVIVRLP